MIIKEIRIKSFGKIKDKTIRLSDGFNVIFGNNESGKTTIITFIRFMLYGGQGRINPVKDYFPLDLSEPSGEMVISQDDKEYLIVRKGVKKKGSYAIVTNLNNGEVITGEKAEEFILDTAGISEEMFSSTLYIKDISDSTFLAKSEILKRLENLSSSGDELVNYEEIINSLNEEKLSLTSPKRKDAIIPGLMTKIQEYEKEISVLEERIHSKDELKIRLDKAIREEKELTKSVENAKDESDAILYKLNQSLVDLNNKISETEKSIPKEFLVFDEAEGEILKNSEKIIKNKWEYFIYGVIFVITLISFMVSFLPYVILSFGLLLCIGNFVYFSSLKKKLSLAFARYNAKDYDDVMEKVLFFREKNNELSLLKKRRDDITKDISELSNIKENNKNILADNMKRTVDAVTRKNRIQTELEAITLIEKKLKDKEKEYKEIKESLEKYSEYVKIIDDTKEMIGNAYEKLKKDFSPVVSEIAGKVFSFVTQNADEKIVVSDELNLSLRRNEGFYSVANLSRSTLDLIYFSFRMAVIETVVDNLSTLIFDEAFIRYDKNRLKRVFNYLDSSSHQIIFTTFSEYELSIISDKCEFNLINL